LSRLPTMFGDAVGNRQRLGRYARMRGWVVNSISCFSLASRTVGSTNGTGAPSLCVYHDVSPLSVWICAIFLIIHQMGYLMCIDRRWRGNSSPFTQLPLMVPPFHSVAGFGWAVNGSCWCNGRGLGKARPVCRCACPGGRQCLMMRWGIGNGWAGMHERAAG
jgi:hypothetical protein